MQLIKYHFTTEMHTLYTWFLHILPHHNKGVILASWGRNSPTNKERIEAIYYCSFVRGIHRWPMDSPTKGQHCQIIRKQFMTWRLMKYSSLFSDKSKFLLSQKELWLFLDGRVILLPIHGLRLAKWLLWQGLTIAASQIYRARGGSHITNLPLSLICSSK